MTKGTVYGFCPVMLLLRMKIILFQQKRKKSFKPVDIFVIMERTGMEQNGSRAGANMAAILLYSFVTSPFILTFF